MSAIVQDLGAYGVRRAGRSTVAFLVPIRTAPGQNVRENRGRRIVRVQAERGAVALCWPKFPVPLPCTVQLTRISPGQPLDPKENLPASLKAVVDELARLIGVDDADPRVTWLPDKQERGEWGVWVEITSPLGGPVLAPLPRPVRVKRPRKAKPGVPAPRIQPTPASYPPPPRRATP